MVHWWNDTEMENPKLKSESGLFFYPMFPNYRKSTASANSDM